MLHSGITLFTSTLDRREMQFFPVENVGFQFRPLRQQAYSQPSLSLRARSLIA
jgi:hypothetical protein